MSGVAGVSSCQNFLPSPPKSIEEVKLPYYVLEGIILRLMFHHRELTGEDIAKELGLPFYGVVETLLQIMRDNRQLEITGGEMASVSYNFAITDLGREMAYKSMQLTNYTGAAPVSLEEYVQGIQKQSFCERVVDWENLRRAFHDLIFEESILAQVGPAINSGRSLFLYGPPGNGKSSIAERLVRVMGDAIFIPECLEVYGNIIKLFDPFNHHEAGFKEDVRASLPYDKRWRLIKRPFLVAGGELTLESLDLNWNPHALYYEAPLQLKANCGGLMIDDFGRQRMDPKALLNRWIVPLDRKVDYLTLATGAKIQVPFDELIIFSTNLDPADLVDEAFLRRIRYKIAISSPSRENFHRIWQMECAKRAIQCDMRLVDYFIDHHVLGRKIALRACHARDLIDHVEDICRFNGWESKFTKELIDAACESYFVSFHGAQIVNGKAYF